MAETDRNATDQRTDRKINLQLIKNILSFSFPIMNDQNRFIFEIFFDYLSQLIKIGVTSGWGLTGSEGVPEGEARRWKNWLWGRTVIFHVFFDQFCGSEIFFVSISRVSISRQSTTTSLQREENVIRFKVMKFGIDDVTFYATLNCSENLSTLIIL